LVPIGLVESSTYLLADDTKGFREIREENDEKMLQADLDTNFRFFVRYEINNGGHRRT
jgi:hypothetical protein